MLPLGSGCQLSNTCRNCAPTFPEGVHTFLPSDLQSKGCASAQQIRTGGSIQLGRRA